MGHRIFISPRRWTRRRGSRSISDHSGGSELARAAKVRAGSSRTPIVPREPLVRRQSTEAVLRRLSLDNGRAPFGGRGRDELAAGWRGHACCLDGEVDNTWSQEK